MFRIEAARVVCERRLECSDALETLGFEHVEETFQRLGRCARVP